MDTVPSGSKLLIDGNSFMFWIMKQTSAFSNRQIDRRYVGSFREFRDMIIEKIAFLTELGFDVVIYFDGRNGERQHDFKQLTLEERREGINDAWVTMHQTIKYRKTVFDQDVLPLPTLTRYFFELVLKLACRHVKIINCKGEADIFLGLACAVDSERSYIVSEDSDFVGMKDCSVIRFPQLFSQKTPKESYDMEVWRRTSVCQVMGLSEKQFVDFCCLYGSDFTSPFFKNDRTKVRVIAENGRPLEQLPDGFGWFKFCESFQNMQGWGENYIVECDDELLMLAIKYTRAFFELGDLSVFNAQLEEVVARQTDADAGEQQEGWEEDNASIDDADVVTDDGEEDDDECREKWPSLTDSLNDMIWDFLSGRTFLFSQSGSVCLEFLAAKKDEILSDKGSPWVRQLHLNALHQMLEDIQVGTYYLQPANRGAGNEGRLDNVADAIAEVIDGGGGGGGWSDDDDGIAGAETDANSDESKAPTRRLNVIQAAVDNPAYSPFPTWENICAARVYLLVLERIMRWRFPITNLDADRDTIEVFYDGRLYHQLLESEEEENEANENLTDEDRSVAVEAEVPEAEIPDLPEGSLPVDAYRRQIVEAVGSNRVTMIWGETGCGKSTRVNRTLHHITHMHYTVRTSCMKLYHTKEVLTQNFILNPLDSRHNTHRM